MKDFLELIRGRRSVYALNTNTAVSQKQIMNVIERCVYEAPSAFNSQSPRIVVLFKDSSKKFWNLTMDSLRKVIPPEKFGPTEEKINAFMQGVGTILFYEDDKITQDLQEKFPTYKALFPQWAEHNNAILQYMVWAALTELGLGANLQHYNPLVDEMAATSFDIPKNWRLIAQLNFGAVVRPADEKSHEPLKDRIKVFE